MSKQASHRLSLALQTKPATHALIDLGLEFFFNQPIESWLDLEITLESIESVYQPQVMRRLLSEWIPRAIDRSKGLEAMGVQPLSTWLTPELDAEFRSICAGNQLLSPARIQAWVKHPLTHHVTQAFVEETLQRFIQRVRPSGDSGGLLGVASRGALGWATKASRGALGGLGEQLQNHLGSLTSEFISASMGVLLDQLGRILGTPEVSRLVAEAQLKWYDNLRSSPLSDSFKMMIKEVDQQVSSQVIEDWSELISDWIAHLLEHPELADFVGKAHQDLLSEIGHKTPRQLINDEDTLKSLKESAKASLTPTMISLAHHDSFNEWCTKYL